MRRGKTSRIALCTLSPPPSPRGWMSPTARIFVAESSLLSDECPCLSSDFFLWERRALQTSRAYTAFRVSPFNSSRVTNLILSVVLFVYSNVNLPLPRTVAIESTLPKPDFIAAVEGSAFPGATIQTSLFAVPVFLLECKDLGAGDAVPQLACVAKPTLDLYRIMGVPDNQLYIFAASIVGDVVELHVFDMVRPDATADVVYRHRRLMQSNTQLLEDRLALANAMVAIAADAVIKRQELIKQQIPAILTAAAENESRFEEEREDDDDDEDVYAGEVNELKAPRARHESPQTLVDTLETRYGSTF
ncbi:uncharacterized protein EV422DRAFT_324841 [Fimicolochytrium jonesii]|uniref:uncharacterized protein n=1 Tax=Fimicolochytrium jonesii TaxID=1396493 RepID=UPI0022FEED89|nr:uncharacterized protein EV422DRAFT_324841 [Fimicolochytrium jonesii]KAI8824547.1 hypothetical protein EV422DRAFT_324841 [Fimicolochytrium jonesii]